MVLERTQGGHHNGHVRPQPRLAAFDVDELLGAEIGPEAGLGDHVIPQFERGACRGHGVAAVGDVGERAAMDDGRIVLQRLYQVGLDRVLEQCGHRPLRLQVAGPDRRLLTGVADDDVAQSRLEVLARGGQAKDRHHFGRNDDVKSILARETIAGSAQRHHGGAQRTVVHVHDTPPDDASHIEAQRIAVMDVVVQQRRQQVVRQRNRVEVAGEVQVDVFHRNDLRMAATGSAPLHAEHRPQRGFAQGDHRAFTDAVEGIAQADGGGGLAFTGRRRADGRDQHQFAVRAVLSVEPCQVDLGLVVAIRLQGFGRNAQPVLCQQEDGPQRCRLRDLDVRQGHGVS